MKGISELITDWANSLTKRLVEIRFVDVEEMKVSISVHIKSALYDCLRIQLPKAEQEYIDAKIKFQLAADGGNNTTKIQEQLISLKAKLKEQNKLHAELDRENMNREMVLWMKKHNEKKLLQFYDYYNNKFPKPTKL